MSVHTDCHYTVQAAHHEASALGAVTAWYRDVQRKHAAAGLGDDPIIASILPGSSKKLGQRDAPPDSDAQAEQPEVSRLPFCAIRLTQLRSLICAFSGSTRIARAVLDRLLCWNVSPLCLPQGCLLLVLQRSLFYLPLRV